ncbi:MAG: hypothetical protein ACOVS5_08370 [Oligoflexus sp.]|jgi:hypothetical protein
MVPKLFIKLAICLALVGHAYPMAASNSGTAFKKQPDEPAGLRSGHLFFRFPVTWEIMRSGFNTLDVAMEAETYVESWAIHRVSAQEVYLLTPRARTRVVPLLIDESNEVDFDTLALTEVQFAQLLGLAPVPVEAAERKILIQLPIAETVEQNLILTASPKYFISVHLNLSF